MITRNMKNLMACTLQSSSTVCGTLPVTGVNGIQYFLTTNFAFPGSRAEAFTNAAGSAGISFGTGGTAGKETDYNLEATLTSGISVTLTAKTMSHDQGKPYVKYAFTVTNTGSEPVTIREVGYKQTVKAATFAGGTSASDVVVLIDRTVLSSPITIQGGDAGVIEYTLKTAPATKTVSGVKIVSFTYGTDEEIAAMIDAARAGTIDLQTDGDWAVGDTRTIQISAFSGGGSVSHAAQSIDIAISSFEDYNGCGCLFQFDFVESLATGQRMNSSNTNVGGYGASEMKTTTLPALVDALPSWLSSRLKTFSVLASAGNQSATIETVTGNKLALRSEIEIFGTTSYSKAGEGSQIEWYKRGVAVRTKRQGRTGSANYWWERSPYGSGSNSFCFVSGDGNASNGNASYARGLSPFGCI